MITRAPACDVIKHNTVTYNDHALEETMDDDVSPGIDIRVHDTTSEGTVNTGISLFGFVATNYVVRVRPANDAKNGAQPPTQWSTRQHADQSKQKEMPALRFP